MDITENKTVDFYKSSNETTPKIMYNVSLNNETLKHRTKLFNDTIQFVLQDYNNRLNDTDLSILKLEPDFQTTNIKDVDTAYYDVIECYPITDESNNTKHITKNTLFDILNTFINNLNDIPKFIM